MKFFTAAHKGGGAMRTMQADVRTPGLMKLRKTSAFPPAFTPGFLEIGLFSSLLRRTIREL